MPEKILVTTFPALITTAEWLTHVGLLEAEFTIEPVKNPAVGGGSVDVWAVWRVSLRQAAKDAAWVLVVDGKAMSSDDGEWGAAVRSVYLADPGLRRKFIFASWGPDVPNAVGLPLPPRVDYRIDRSRGDVRIRDAMRQALEEEKEGAAHKSEDGRIRVASVPDLPAGVDQIGFKPYLEAVTDFLADGQTMPPLVMSVEGDWGSGKSTFMSLLHEELRGRFQSPGDFKAVWFNAWRHSNDEALWASFALAFIEALDEGSLWVRMKRRVALARQRFRLEEAWPDIARLVLYVAMSAIAVVVAIVVLVQGPAKSVDPAPHRILGLFTGTLGAVLAREGFKKARELIGNPFKIDLKSYVRAPDYKGKVPFVELFHEDFRRIIQAYAPGDKKVFVFIDDLDRCEPPKAADLMAALNLMMADAPFDTRRAGVAPQVPPLVYVLGMDRDKVAVGLAVKYEKMVAALSPVKDDPAAALDFGHNFLEKFIQLPFRVPPLSEDRLNEWLREVLTRGPVERKAGASEVRKEGARKNRGKAKNTEPQAPIPASGATAEGPGANVPSAAQPKEPMTIWRHSADSDHVIQIVGAVASALDFNPRRIKHFINLFRLRTYIAYSTGLFGANKPKADDKAAGEFRRLTIYKLGKLVALELRWPRLVGDLLAEPMLLTALALRAPELLGALPAQAKAPEPTRPGTPPAPAKAPELALPESYKRWVGRKALLELLDATIDDVPPVETLMIDLDIRRLLRVSRKVAPPRAWAPQPSQVPAVPAAPFQTAPVEVLKEPAPTEVREKSSPVATPPSSEKPLARQAKYVPHSGQLEIATRLETFTIFAREYEALRGMEPGQERTHRCEQHVVMPVHEAGARAHVSDEDVHYLFRQGEGGRLVALVLAEDLESPGCFDLILDAVRDPRSAFEAWHALRAARLIAPRLQPSEHRALVAATKDRMTSEAVGTRYDESDPELFRFARGIMGSQPPAG